MHKLVCGNISAALSVNLLATVSDSDVVIIILDVDVNLKSSLPLCSAAAVTVALPPGPAYSQLNFQCYMEWPEEEATSAA